MFRLNLNKQKTHPNSLKESVFGYFSENFDVGSKHRNKPKFFVFCFTKQTERNRNKRETDLVSVCFSSNRNLIFVCFEDTH
jgi:hypothetical protein